MKKNIWFIIALVFIGYSAGILTGVVIDEDRVYNTTIKRIKHQRGQGDVVIDVDPYGEKSKKELRKEDRVKRREDRKASRTSP